MTHWLVITAAPEELEETGLEWEIEHEDACPVEAYDDDLTGRSHTEYLCPVAIEVQHVGLDSLDPVWTTLAPGRYPIEVWGIGPDHFGEYDGGLHVVDAPA